LTYASAMEWTRDEYCVSDDRARLDVPVVWGLLRATYWAGERTREAMDTAIEHSLCLGLFHQGRQVGFCRAVTDHVTFTWICDVVIHPEHRGRGLGKWLVECLINHPALQTRAQCLATRDAHGLYERYGFARDEYLKRKKESAS